MLNEGKTRCIQSVGGGGGGGGVGDQSLEWIKARSSLRSKSSVITPLRIHSGFYIPAHGETALCSLHLNIIGDY